MLRVAAALTAAALLAGCGTSPERAEQKVAPSATSAPVTSGVTATPTPAITHVEFVKALNASCAKDKSRADKLEQRFEAAMGRNALKEAGRIYNDIQPILTAHVDRVSKLDVPAPDRDAMRRYMSAEHRIVGYGERIGASLLDNDLASVALLVKPFQREGQRRITAAIDIGADKCGG